MNSLATFMQRFMNVLYSIGFNILALAALPQRQGMGIGKIYLKGWSKKQKTRL